MKTIANLFLVTMLIVSVGNLRAESSNAYTLSVEKEKAEKTLVKAVIALENIMEDPENSIPQSLINESV